MPTQKLEDQIEALIKDGANIEEAKEYLSVVRDNMRLTEEAARRAVRLLLLFCFAFELLSRAAVTELSLAGIKIQELPLIHKLLPLGIAYMYYLVSCHYTRRRLLIGLHDNLMEKAMEPFYRNNLEYYGHFPSNFSTHNLLIANSTGLYAKLLWLLSFPIIIALTIGPGIFLVYCSCRCFVEYGFTDVLVWLVTILSVVMVFHSLLTWQGVNRIIPAE